MALAMGKVGKVALEAGGANSLLLSDGELWVRDAWSRVGCVTAAGFAISGPQLSRLSVLGGHGGRVAFSFTRAEPEGDGVVDVVGTVMREPSLEFGAERVLMRIPQSSGVFVRFMVAARDLSHVALVLGSSMGAPISTLVVWREGQEVARYENLVAAEGGSVSGIAFTADGSSVLAITGGRLTRYPVTQGAPTSAAIDIGFEAFQSLGGARHLPVSGSALLLHQYPHGALGLFTEEGAPLFVHSAPQAYCTRELRRSVASLAPSGRWIVAAVGAPDALDGNAVIEVFDARGSSARRIEWKCAKSEYASDVAIDDEGWIALATNKKLEIFAPEGYAAPKKSKSRGA
jgi:hypothetical protein